MKFSQDFIEKVRDASNVVEVISQFTQLKKAGANYQGLCPFPDHKEKTASFSVSESKQLYHCFGCKKSGNVFTFVEAMQGFTFPEAVEHLANRAQIPIPEDNRDEAFVSQSQEQKKQLYRINRFAKTFYQQQLEKLPEDSAVKMYLRDRGLKPETVAFFELGLAPDAWTGLVDQLEKQKIPVSLAEDAGLAKARGQGKVGSYDMFRDRLMFPILSHTGETIAFGGRILGEGQPKYLNSPESLVFHKGRVFYGLHETAKFIRSADQAIVVEGYMDFLALYQAGFTNVVATLGTAMTSDHARMIKRYTKNVLVLFDGDDAGMHAAERSLPILLQEGLYPRSLILPDRYDPDEFLQEKGVPALKALLDKSPELFSWVMDRVFHGFQGRESEKVQIVDRVAPILKVTVDTRLRELYQRELAERLAVPPGWLHKALQGTNGGGAGIRTSEPLQAQIAKSAPVAVSVASAPEAKTPQTGAPPAKIRIEKAPRAELELLNLAIKNEEHLKEIWGLQIVDQMQNAGVRETFCLLFELYGQMPNEFDKLNVLLLERVEPTHLLMLHLEKPLVDMTPEGASKLIKDCAKKIRDVSLRKQHQVLASSLRADGGTIASGKLEQIVNIQRSRKRNQALEK